MKGVTIFLVVFGHCMQYENGRDFAYSGEFLDYILYKAIYSFHMPLFALVSGYLFFWSVSSRRPREVLIRQVNNLILPIVSWSVVFQAASTALHIYRGDFAGLSAALMKLYSRLHGFWFLWAMFYCSIIVLLVREKFRDSILVYVLMLFLLILIPGRIIPSSYVFMFPYFAAGYLWHREGMDKKFSLSDHKLLCAGIILLWCIMLVFYGRSSYVYTTGTAVISYKNGIFMSSQLWTDIFRWVIGFAGCGAVLIILKLIKPVKFIAAIGTRSLGIYITSGAVTKAVLLSLVTENIYIIRFIQSVVITAVCYALSEAVSRVKILNRILFGGR